VTVTMTEVPANHINYLLLANNFTTSNIQSSPERPRISRTRPNDNSMHGGLTFDRNGISILVKLRHKP